MPGITSILIKRAPGVCRKMLLCDWTIPNVYTGCLCCLYCISIRHKNLIYVNSNKNITFWLCIYCVSSLVSYIFKTWAIKCAYHVIVLRSFCDVYIAVLCDRMSYIYPIVQQGNFESLKYNCRMNRNIPYACHGTHLFNTFVNEHI